MIWLEACRTLIHWRAVVAEMPTSRPDLRHVQGLGAPGGAGAQETLEIPEAADLQQVPDIPLQIGGQIALVPSVAGDRIAGIPHKRGYAPRQRNSRQGGASSPGWAASHSLPDRPENGMTAALPARLSATDFMSMKFCEPERMNRPFFALF